MFEQKNISQEDIRVWKAQVSSLLDIRWCISKINYNINPFILSLTGKKSMLHRKEPPKKKKKHHLAKVYLFLISLYKCFACLCVCVPHVCLLSAEA